MAISRDVMRRAAAQPRRPAVVGPCGSLTFGQLATRARDRAESLRTGGVTSGSCVTTDDEDPTRLLVDLVAIDLLAAVAVVTDSAWPPDLRANAVEAALAAAAVPAGPASLVVFTSGSTRTPRPVVRTRESWTFSFPSFSALTGIGPDDTVLIPGRMSASLFLYGALHALTMGAAVCPLPSWSPTLAAEAAAHCTAAHVVPPMLATLAARPDATAGRLRLAVCAGAQLDPTVDAAARAAGIEVVDYYGAAELSFVAIRLAGAAPGRMRPFPGVDVEVREGVLWARSPYLAKGLERDPEGFASVGDHGIRHDDGTLTVHGRADQAITSGGATVAPEAVESAVRRAAGVAEVAVVGAPHGHLGEVVVAIVEAADSAVVALRTLRATVAEHLPPSQRPRIWYLVDRLPRTGSGKVARAEVVAGLADGTLGVRALS